MTRTQYARHQSVTPSRVNHWLTDKRLVLDAEGRIDVSASDAALDSTRAFGKGSADANKNKKESIAQIGENTYAAQQIQRVGIQTERQRLALQRDLGRFVDAKRSAQGTAEAFTAVREAWLGAAARLHTRLAAESDPRRCYQMMEEDARKSLDELATALEDKAAASADDIPAE